MNIEQTPSCTNDYIALYNGPDTNSPLVGRYCGSSLPAPYTTTSRQLAFVFVSDDVNNAQGFRATYTSV